MKKLKKVFAVLLTLAMVMGMSVTAFAADPTTTVTVKGLKNGTVVEYVKLVQPVNSPEGWEFADGITADTIGMSLQELKDAVGEDETNSNSYAENGKINSTLLAKLSTANLSNLLKDPKTAADAKVSYEGLGAGLYAFRSIDTSNEYVYSWTIAYVGYKYDGPTASLPAEIELTAKGEKFNPGKTIDEESGWSVTKDDTVAYTISSIYPFYAVNSPNAKVFEIQDTISGGKFAGTEENPFAVTVTVGGNGLPVKTLTEGTDYRLTVDEETNTFTVDLGGTYYNSEYAGQPVTIKYNVTVTSTTTKDPLTNEEKTTITDPNGDPIVKYDKVISNLVSASITKVDADNGNQPLNGAEFTLYVGVPDEDAAENMEGVVGYFTPANGDKPGAITLYKDEDDKTSKPDGTVWVKVVETQTTGDETEEGTGVAFFDGLDAQKRYFVVETKAPEGYSLNTAAYELKGAVITESKDVEYHNADGTVIENPGETPIVNGTCDVTTYTATNFNGFVGGTDGVMQIEDTHLSQLPSTGGIGTTIFTIGGCAIMIIAAGLFFASRRKSDGKEAK